MGILKLHEKLLPSPPRAERLKLDLPSLHQHLVEVSNILAGLLHGLVKGQLTLPVGKIHLEKERGQLCPVPCRRSPTAHTLKTWESGKRVHPAGAGGAQALSQPQRNQAGEQDWPLLWGVGERGGFHGQGWAGNKQGVSLTHTRL